MSNNELKSKLELSSAWKTMFSETKIHLLHNCDMANEGTVFIQSCCMGDGIHPVLLYGRRHSSSPVGCMGHGTRPALLVVWDIALVQACCMRISKVWISWPVTWNSSINLPIDLYAGLHAIMFKSQHYKQNSNTEASSISSSKQSILEYNF